MLIKANTVFTGEKILSPGVIQIANGRIVEVSEQVLVANESVEDVGDAIILPGFVDQHCHGGGAVAFTDGVKAAEKVIQTHLIHGTTSMVASLVTDTLDKLEAQVSELNQLVEANQLLGIHLEGPWLAEKYKGAHRLDLLRDPKIEEIARLKKAGKIVMVTIAVERAYGQEAVKFMTANNIIAAPGHTDASYEQMCEAIDNGANVITHLFNAMRPLHHRLPGPIAAAYECPGVVVEVIADGVHLHPSVVRQIFNIKGRDVVLVTDAMAAAGSPDGQYLLGPLEVTVDQGVARLTDGGNIAGSTLTLDKAIKFCVTKAGISLWDAVRAATSRPAEVLGETQIGQIRENCWADLVVMRPNLSVAKVMKRGSWV